MKITYKIYNQKTNFSYIATKTFRYGLKGFANYRNLMETRKYKITILNIEKVNA